MLLKHKCFWGLSRKTSRLTKKQSVYWAAQLITINKNTRSLKLQHYLFFLIRFFCLFVRLLSCQLYKLLQRKFLINMYDYKTRQDSRLLSLANQSDVWTDRHLVCQFCCCYIFGKVLVYCDPLQRRCFLSFWLAIMLHATLLTSS